MNENQCTRKGCFAQRPELDRLFCVDCRIEWRKKLIEMGLSGCLDESIIEPVLKRFIEGEVPKNDNNE